MKTLKHIEIVENSVFIDGVKSLGFEGENDFSLFARHLYKNLKIEYSKFYKMSNMCKLGFLSSEFLLKDYDMSKTDKTKFGLVFSCRSSSIDADEEYQKSISEIPSPALFVYTLPNIVIGEICIKNGFKGEEIMLIQESFNKEFLFNYAQLLFDENRIENCIIGFVEYDKNGKYFSSMYLLSCN